MKLMKKTDTLVVKDTTVTSLPIKVCMHIQGTARTEYRFMRNATALAEAGFAVSVVDVEADRSRSVEEYIHGIAMKHIIMPKWFVPTRFKPWFLVKELHLIIIGVIQLLRTETDIYHAYVEKALPACYIAALLRHKPLIFDSPELPLSEPTVTRWRMLCALSNNLLAVMMRRCAGVIAVSPPIVEKIRNRYHIPTMTLIRNVPVYREVQKSDRLRQYLGLNPEVRIALYQGSIQPDRGLDKLIYATAFLEPDIVIAMMGKGFRETPSQLKSLITSLGVADRVKIIPPVPYEELLDWTASADIGLIVYTPDYSLNVQWMLPNKLFEFLMAGLPVLASPLDATAEIIRTYDVGRIVPSLAPADIGMAINTLLADRVALARMHRNALDIAKREFYWERESQKLIQLYNTILTNDNLKEKELTG